MMYLYVISSVNPGNIDVRKININYVHAIFKHRENGVL